MFEFVIGSVPELLRKDGGVFLSRNCMSSRLGLGRGSACICHGVAGGAFGNLADLEITIPLALGRFDRENNVSQPWRLRR